MALQFVAGSAGSGKSHTVYQKIIEASLKDPAGRFFVIVPEQFTMLTQKELVRMHPDHSIMNIDVLSFHRLAARVFDEVGFNEQTVLEDMGKTLILQKVIWENRNALSVLGRTMDRVGGVEEMKSLASELMQYRVAPADLLEMAEEEGISPLLKLKLKDLYLIYEKLKEKIAGKYLAAEEVCEALGMVIGESSLLKDSTVVFDGFTGFVPVQLPVVRQILKMAKEVSVVITTDRKAGIGRKSTPADLFHLSAKMAGELIRMAEEEGVPVLDPVWADETKGRFANSPALAFLEENLFRTRAARYEEKPDGLRILCAGNREEEIGAAASALSRLVRTEGYRYRDFAVICSDLNAYGQPLLSHFRDCGIPCFLDQKQPVTANPFASFLRGAAAVYSDDFSYDSVMTWLRSGLTNFTPEEIDRLENYLLAAGIRGMKKYSSIWTKIPKTFEPGDLAGLNELRTRLMEELAGTTEVFKTRMSTVGSKTEALYRLAAASHVQEKLKRDEEAFEKSGDKARAREYAQVYKAVIDFLDKLSDILGEEKIGVAAYEKLLETGLSQMRLGIIPTGPDEVFIGDIERSRVKNVKVLFFLGVNDGAVPRHAGKTGLLNESDRERLTSAGMELAPSDREEMYRQRFYLYLCLTLASEKVFLTYKKTGPDGKGQMPSYLIGVLTRLFPQLIPEDITEEQMARLETAPGRTAALLDSFREAQEGKEVPGLFELYLRMEKDAPEIAGRVRAGAGLKKRSGQIEDSTAEELYSDYYSVSRLQKFAECAFSHFCRYGLKLEDRELFEVKSADVGTLIHDVLESFLTLAEKKGGIRGMTAKEREALAEEAFDIAVGSHESTVFLESFRSRAQTKRLKRIIGATIEVVQYQLEAGEFVPEGIEKEYTLGSLHGRIDRYDVCRVGNKAYVRVIDYKSGSEDVDYTKMVYGLQIQLPVYLTAAMDQVGKDAEPLPAGLYYLNVSSPMIETGSMSEEVSYDAFLKKLKFNGLTLDCMDVVKMQDAEADRGMVLPVQINKNGTFRKGTKVISEGDFRLIERYTKQLIRDLQAQIRAGNVQIGPAVKKPEDPGSCQYCDYKSVCAFDPKLPGYKKKIMKEQKLNNMFQTMSEVLRKGGEE